MPLGPTSTLTPTILPAFYDRFNATPAPVALNVDPGGLFLHTAAFKIVAEFDPHGAKALLLQFKFPDMPQVWYLQWYVSYYINNDYPEMLSSSDDGTTVLAQQAGLYRFRQTNFVNSGIGATAIVNIPPFAVGTGKIRIWARLGAGTTGDPSSLTLYAALSDEPIQGVAGGGGAGGDATAANQAAEITRLTSILAALNVATPQPTLSLGGSGAITHFADAGGGKVRVTTAAAHGLANGSPVLLAGTTNYNGPFAVSNVTADTFEITAAWVADDAAGTWAAALDAKGGTGHAYFLSPSIECEAAGITGLQVRGWATYATAHDCQPPCRDKGDMSVYVLWTEAPITALADLATVAQVARAQCAVIRGKPLLGSDPPVPPRLLLTSARQAKYATIFATNNSSDVQSGMAITTSSLAGPEVDEYTADTDPIRAVLAASTYLPGLKVGQVNPLTLSASTKNFILYWESDAPIYARATVHPAADGTQTWARMKVHTAHRLSGTTWKFTSGSANVVCTSGNGHALAEVQAGDWIVIVEATHATMQWVQVKADAGNTDNNIVLTAAWVGDGSDAQGDIVWAANDNDMPDANTAPHWSVNGAGEQIGPLTQQSVVSIYDGAGTTATSVTAEPVA